jgi:hypothetical protein
MFGPTRLLGSQPNGKIKKADISFTRKVGFLLLQRPYFLFKKDAYWGLDPSRITLSQQISFLLLLQLFRGLLQ